MPAGWFRLARRTEYERVDGDGYDGRCRAFVDDVEAPGDVDDAAVIAGQDEPVLGVYFGRAVTS